MRPQQPRGATRTARRQTDAQAPESDAQDDDDGEYTSDSEVDEDTLAKAIKTLKLRGYEPREIGAKKTRRRPPPDNFMTGLLRMWAPTRAEIAAKKEVKDIKVIQAKETARLERKVAKLKRDQKAELGFYKSLPKTESLARSSQSIRSKHSEGSRSSRSSHSTRSTAPSSHSESRSEGSRRKTHRVPDPVYEEEEERDPKPRRKHRRKHQED